VEKAVKMTVKVRKRKSNSMRLPIAVRIVEITSKRLQFFKIFWGACPQTPLGAWRLRRHARCGPSADIKFGLPLSKSWLKAWCHTTGYTLDKTGEYLSYTHKAFLDLENNLQVHVEKNT